MCRWNGSSGTPNVEGSQDLELPSSPAPKVGPVEREKERRGGYIVFLHATRRTGGMSLDLLDWDYGVGDSERTGFGISSQRYLFLFVPFLLFCV